MTKFETSNIVINKIVQYCTTEEKREAGTLYRGYITQSGIYNYLYNESGYTMIYDNGYSIALYNDNLNILLSYCEGDFTVETFDNKEAYNQGKSNTIQWYKDNN